MHTQNAQDPSLVHCVSPRRRGPWSPPAEPRGGQGGFPGEGVLGPHLSAPVCSSITAGALTFRAWHCDECV